MITVKSCCCGCSLRTGTLIIFIIDLKLGVLLINDFKWSEYLGENILYTVLDSLLPAILIGANIVGIYGIVKEKPVCFIPCIVAEGLLVVIPIPEIIAAAILGRAALPYLNLRHDMSEIKTEDDFISAIVAKVILDLIVSGLHVYCIIVVWSFYKELKSRPVQNQAIT